MSRTFVFVLGNLAYIDEMDAVTFVMWSFHPKWDQVRRQRLEIAAIPQKLKDAGGMYGIYQFSCLVAYSLIDNASAAFKSFHLTRSAKRKH